MILLKLLRLMTVKLERLVGKILHAGGDQEVSSGDARHVIDVMFADILCLGCKELVVCRCPVAWAPKLFWSDAPIAG